MTESLISEFVDKKTLDALSTFLDTSDNAKALESAVKIADVFCLGEQFKVHAGDKDSEFKLISSFDKNLVLLIQKTWVEKSDEELKAQVLYHQGEFKSFLEKKSYKDAYSLFFSIVEDVVYLMFGAQSKSKDFAEYALRIDPEFGIFWWYISSLPREADWNADKTKTALLLGMFFLANY
ncbi:MAG: hypothetical protein MJZ50_04270 [Treponema sp.]|nr:hypothetical protein [Treponema sp.]